MTRHANRLTVRGVAAESRPGMHSDGGGFYLQVARGGSKSWIYRFMLHGRSRDMGLGGIDVVLLAEAREKALEARKMLKAGTGPYREQEGPAGAAGGGCGDRKDIPILRGELHRQPRSGVEKCKAPGAVAQHAYDLRLPDFRRCSR